MNELRINTKKTGQGGTTLIELSVVIAVILLLVGVLFIGVTAWKNGANRAACIVNLSSIQKAVRGYENMNLRKEGEPLSVEMLTKAKFWQFTPECPAGGQYTFLPYIPAQGIAYTTCSIEDHNIRDLEGREYENFPRPRITPPPQPPERLQTPRHPERD